MAKTEQYVVYRDEDGNWTMDFGRAPSKPSHSGMPAQDDPKFASLAEMKQTILTGDFTEEEMITIWSFFVDESGVVELPDLDHLYEPTLAAELPVKGIYWGGSKGYTFIYDATQMPTVPRGTITVSYMTEDSFREGLKEYTEFTSNENLTFLSEERDPFTGGTIYTYRTFMGYTFKDILYTITEGDKTLYVKEEGGTKMILIWGEENGVYFYARFSYSQRPALEWIRSIGMVPYVEETPNP